MLDRYRNAIPKSLKILAAVALPMAVMFCVGTPANSQTAIPASVITLADGYAALARSAMDNGLRDFPSARVRNVRATYSKRIDGGRDRLTFCGEINAKNGEGGYTGWQHFALLPGSDSAPTLVDTDVHVEEGPLWSEAVHRFCESGNENWLPKDYTADFSPQPSSNLRPG